MYKTPQNTYYLQLFLRQPDEEYPKAQNIRECGTKCTLDEFYKVYEPLIPGEFEIECGLNETEELNQFNMSDPQKILDMSSKFGERHSPNSTIINVNGSIFLIVICNLCLLCILFSKFYYKNRLKKRVKYTVYKI